MSLYVYNHLMKVMRQSTVHVQFYRLKYVIERLIAMFKGYSSRESDMAISLQYRYCT